jgi:hypothetical protein
MEAPSFNYEDAMTLLDSYLDKEAEAASKTSPHYTKIKGFRKSEPEQESQWAADIARLLELDAFQLQQQELAEMKYIPLLGKDGYFVEGWSHIIAGYPRCGKQPGDRTKPVGGVQSCPILSRCVTQLQDEISVPS